MSEKDKRDKDDGDRDHRDKEKRGREEFEFSTTTRGSQVAEYLNRIADGLRQGTLTLGAGGHGVHLQPGETIRLEIEAESKPDKGTASLQLELSWKLAQETRESHDEALLIETQVRAPQLTAYTPKIKEA
jgi:amphi-Trp domain-containing protein